jgi:hypothetical protein
MTIAPDLVEFATDPQLLGLSLSTAQETLLRALDALPMSREHVDLYQHCTGRTALPAQPFPSATVLTGARGGKDSRIIAPCTLHTVLFGGHDHELGRGEHATVPVVMPTTRQTRITFNYLRDYVLGAPLLRARLADEPTQSELRFTNRHTVVCFACTGASLRGWSIPFGNMNELGFYRLEGQADSDVEIQAAIRRGMVAFTHPRLLKVSTPYMRSGLLYDDVKRAFGVDDPDLLVWKAPTALMNPSITARALDRERRIDPQRFAREFEAEFAEDIAAFLPADWVEAAVSRGVFGRAPQPGLRYVAATDPSGGGPDAFTFCVCHIEGADVTTARVVVRELAEQARAYGVTEVVGDRYASGWVRQAFAEAGLRYRETPWDRSAAYGNVEPLFAQGRLDLLDHATAVREFLTLERRPSPGGKDRIDHPSHGHDDYSNVVALAASSALATLGPSRRPSMFNPWTGQPITADEW